MSFRFQITAAHPARRPVIVLEGEVLEGSVQAGDRLSVPLVAGGRIVGTVLGVEHGWPRRGSCVALRAGEQDKPVGLGVGFPAGCQASDIAPGVVIAAHDLSPPEIPPAQPFFLTAEVARLIQGKPVGEPLPFDPADDSSIYQFYAELVQRIEREQGLRARVEWHHYGSGYASFIEAWFYPADGRASLPPFQASGERHVGLVVLLSRLSRYFVLGQDEKAWSADGDSGELPNFSSVDDLTHPAVLALVAPVTILLAARGLQRLSRSELAAFLPEDAQVPTILTDEPFRQFDALFHWED